MHAGKLSWKYYWGLKINMVLKIWKKICRRKPINNHQIWQEMFSVLQISPTYYIWPCMTLSKSRTPQCGSYRAKEAPEAIRNFKVDIIVDCTLATVRALTSCTRTWHKVVFPFITLQSRTCFHCPLSTAWCVTSRDILLCVLLCICHNSKTSMATSGS
jgi:hypothetical protein